MNVDEVIDRLNKSFVSDLEKQTIGDWLKKNAPTLVSITAVEVRKLLNAMNSKETSVKYYKQLVDKMTWEERIQLMKLSAEQLRKSTSPNLNLAAILVFASELAIKFLPVLIAII